MLASSSNQISSFPFMNQSTLLEKSIHDENEKPTSRLEQHCPPSLQFTDCYSPFLDDEFILGHILYSQKQQLLDTFAPEVELECANNANEEITKKVPCQKKIRTDHASTKKPISRKRSSTKDRHSKICTSKGPRDRRMRLSLEIARSFFDLQDMLGFDKASKTVEWLFAKSRSAIKELKEKYFAEAKCNHSNDTVSYDSTALVRNCSVYDEAPREKKRRKLRIVDKESRYKARARARERTREKLIHRLEKSKQDSEASPIPAPDALQTSPQECCFPTQEMKSLSGIKVGEVEEPGGQFLDYQTHISHCSNAKILGMKGKTTTSLIHNHCENKVLSRETCSGQVHLPGSPMDMGTMSLDSMKASPGGLKVLELDEVDHVLIFYAE